MCQGEGRPRARGPQLPLPALGASHVSPRTPPRAPGSPEALASCLHVCCCSYQLLLALPFPLLCTFLLPAPVRAGPNLLLGLPPILSPSQWPGAVYAPAFAHLPGTALDRLCVCLSLPLTVSFTHASFGHARKGPGSDGEREAPQCCRGDPSPDGDGD